MSSNWSVGEFISLTIKQFVCSHPSFNRLISKMVRCYEHDMGECSLHFNLLERVRILRLMLSIQSTQQVLCSDEKTGFLELVKSAICIGDARGNGSCDHNTLGVGANVFFTRMLRFQTGSEGCQPLNNFKNCLRNNMQVINCDKTALDFVVRTIDAWIFNYCTRGGVYVTDNHSSRTSSNIFYHILSPSIAMLSFFLISKILIQL